MCCWVCCLSECVWVLGVEAFMWLSYIPHIHPCAPKPVQSVLTLLSVRCWSVTPRLQIRSIIWTSFCYISLLLNFLSRISFFFLFFFSFSFPIYTERCTHACPRDTLSCLPALKPECVSVKSLSYFSGWWNILPRPENIINRGPHCLLWALAGICNVIIFKLTASSCAFIVSSDHNF